MNANSKKNKFGNSKIVVNRNMKIHENDPFFVKKAEAAKQIIDKYGLPKKLTSEGK